MENQDKITDYMDKHSIALQDAPYSSMGTYIPLTFSFQPFIEFGSALYK